MHMDWKDYAKIAGIALLAIFVYHSGFLNFLMPGRKRVTDKTLPGDEYASGKPPAAP